MQVERPSFKEARKQASKGFDWRADFIGARRFERSQRSLRALVQSLLGFVRAFLMEGSGRRVSNAWEHTLWFGIAQGNLD